MCLNFPIEYYENNEQFAFMSVHDKWDLLMLVRLVSSRDFDTESNFGNFRWTPSSPHRHSTFVNCDARELCKRKCIIWETKCKLQFNVAQQQQQKSHSWNNLSFSFSRKLERRKLSSILKIMEICSFSTPGRTFYSTHKSFLHDCKEIINASWAGRFGVGGSWELSRVFGVEHKKVIIYPFLQGLSSLLW